MLCIELEQHKHACGRKIEMKNEKNEKNHHSSAEKFYFIEVSTYNTITTEEDFPPHYFAVSSTIGINPIK